jgi:hypothetical protein
VEHVDRDLAHRGAGAGAAFACYRSQTWRRAPAEPGPYQGLFVLDPSRTVLARKPIAVTSAQTSRKG